LFSFAAAAIAAADFFSASLFIPFSPPFPSGYVSSLSPKAFFHGFSFAIFADDADYCRFSLLMPTLRRHYFHCLHIFAS
jgi:hypothetical protein